MQTEELHLQPRRRDPHALSRALQPLAPRSCELVTSWGRPVTLSSAGYVLRFGHSYRLRVVLPLAETEIKELRLVNLPQCIEQSPAIREVDEGGQVWVIPFKIRFEFWSGVTSRLGLDMCCDDLELVAYGAPTTRQEDLQCSCPIIVSRPWLFIVLMAILGLVLSLIPQVSSALFEQDPRLGKTFLELLQTSMSRPASWWAIGVATLLGILVSGGVRLGTVLWHCRKLRGRFQETYPSVEEPT